MNHPRPTSLWSLCCRNCRPSRSGFFQLSAGKMDPKLESCACHLQKHLRLQYQVFDCVNSHRIQIQSIDCFHSYLAFSLDFDMDCCDFVRFAHWSFWSNNSVVTHYQWYCLRCVLLICYDCFCCSCYFCCFCCFCFSMNSKTLGQNQILSPRIVM